MNRIEVYTALKSRHGAGLRDTYGDWIMITLGLIEVHVIIIIVSLLCGLTFRFFVK